MAKGGKGKKKTTVKSRGTSNQIASHYLEATDNPVAPESEPEPEPEPVVESGLEPLPESPPESVPQSASEPEPMPVAVPGFEPIRKPVPDPVPDTGFEAARTSAVEHDDIADIPVTGDNEATETVSQRMEETTGVSTTLNEPVLLDYAQPNIR
jgi:outer membrane biosynthesis protein TonB